MQVFLYNLHLALAGLMHLFVVLDVSYRLRNVPVLLMQRHILSRPAIGLTLDIRYRRNRSLLWKMKLHNILIRCSFLMILLCRQGPV